MAVCRSWRSIGVRAKQNKHFHLRPQLPWLMLSSNSTATEEDTYYHGFFSLSHGKVFRLNLPEVYGARCCGSSWGWLIMADMAGHNFLLNAFSKLRIQLPSQATLRSSTELTSWKWGPFFIRKAILVSLPTTTTTTTTTTTNSFLALNGNSSNDVVIEEESNDFVVVAIYAIKYLCFCRPGDNTWTACGYDHNMEVLRNLQDVIMYKGQLLGVTFNYDLIHIELGGPSPKATSWNIPTPLGYDFSVPKAGETIYLVESCGDLLMVLRFWSFFSDDVIFNDAQVQTHWSFPPPLTTMFEIYKLDPRGPCWDIIETLGDQMLFVGTSSGISLSATHYPGFQGNCIYFTDDNFCNPEFTDVGDGAKPRRDLGVFHLNDKSIEPFFPNDSHSFLSPSVWFIPPTPNS